MASPKIEHIVGGIVVGVPHRYRDGRFKCHPAGQNMEAEWFSTLEEVADFLRANPRAGVRMTPIGSKIVDDIYIDGVLR